MAEKSRYVKGPYRVFADRLNHCIEPMAGRFRVRVWVPGRGTVHVGSFATVAEAEHARDQYRRKHIEGA